MFTLHNAAFRRGGKLVHTTCEYQWKVLTVLNNPPPVCLFVDVNKHKSQRNKRNHNISLSAMQMMHISFVKPFPILFIKILSTDETLYLTCFFITKACVFCIFVVIKGEGQSLESLWRYPTHEWYIPPVRPFLTNLQAVKSCLWPGKNAA